MWYLHDIGNIYVYNDVEGSACFEYCNEYVDEEGNKLYVPDSMHDKFLDNIGAVEE